ncbi:hypothetical protein ACWD4V_13940 [Streptomyces tsukubensis]
MNGYNASPALATCGLCEGDAEDGQLCRGCTKATAVRLDALPDLYDALGAFLAPRIGERTGRGSRSSGLPVSEPVLNLRGPGGILGVAEDWLAAVRADRNMTAPTHAGSAEARLRAAVRGLLGNLPWIATSWPAAGDFARELRALTADVLSIVDPRGPDERGTRLGHCQAVHDGVLCGSVLRLLPGEKAATCRWCGTAWPPATWVQLKVWQDDADATWLGPEVREGCG